MKRWWLTLFAVLMTACVPKPNTDPNPYRAFAIDIGTPPTQAVAWIDGWFTDGRDPSQVWFATPRTMTNVDNGFLHLDFPALRKDVDLMNIHIRANGYKDYDCVADVPRDVNATAAFNGLTGGNRYAPMNCDAVLIPLKVPVRPGVIQRDGRALHDANGRIHPKGLTFFWAYQGETRDKDRFIKNLDWLTDPAFPWRHPDYVRILGQVDWDGWAIDFTDPNYEANLGMTIDDIYEHCRCRVEVSVVGGPLSKTQALDLIAKVVRVINARLEKIMDLEMTNEYYNKTPIDTMVAMAQYVRANSSVELVGLSSPGDWDQLKVGLSQANGNLFTVHSDRDTGSFKWRQVRQMRDCVNYSQVMSENEPPGPHSSVATNDSPIQLALMRYTAHIQGCALYVLHVGDMVLGQVDPSHDRQANLWEVPGLDDIMKAMAAVEPWIPDDVENWQNTNQHGHDERVGPQPLLADGIWTDGDDHGVDRAYGAVSGNQFVEVLLGVLDHVNVQALRDMSFDVFDPVSGTTQHFDLAGGQSVRLEGRPDSMAGYIVRGVFK